MIATRFPRYFFAVLAVLFAAGMAAPVFAADQITIGYRGSGWYYVGDTVVFNGMNAVGNTTLIRITGPGLPAGGVPPYSPGGTEGSGNPAKFVEGKTWSFSWDTSMIDKTKLSSGKHFVTVWDAEHPEITATTSIVLKQPEFYLRATPSTARHGDYITLNGIAEQGVSYVKIDVTDTSGNVRHTFMSPVVSSGSFSYSFHVDMEPGLYTVTGTNPSMKNMLKLMLTISEPTANITATSTVVTTVPASAATTEQAPTGTAAETTAAGSDATTPVAGLTRAGIGMATPVIALAVFGAAALVIFRKKF
jgi:hypothetical protein